jgi:hypothetical protein
VNTEYVRSTGSSVLIHLPKTALKPSVDFEWKIPPWANAIERDRARTYFQAYAAGCALHFLEQAFNEIRAGHTKTWNTFEVPEEGIGCGFTEAVRGVLSHHLVIRDRKIANYHPYPPTPWNASPRDSYGTPGPYEDSIQGTPIFEENGPESFKGIDIMRAIRSFDPCLPCGVHMFLGKGKTLERVTDVDAGSLASRIESLVGELDADARSQAAARELVRSLMQFYGRAFERVIQMLNDAGDRGEPVTLTRLAADPVVATVLMLHDLHPNPPAIAPAPPSPPLLQITRADGTPVEMVGRARERVVL